MRFKIYDHTMTFKKYEGTDPFMMTIKLDNIPAVDVMDGDTLTLTHNIELSVFDLILSLFKKKVVTITDPSKYVASFSNLNKHGN